MKTSFRFLKGNILVLTITNIIWFFSMRMAVPYFSLYVRELGGSMTAIGFVSVFRALSSFFIYPIAGQIADSVGRVKVIGFTRSLFALMYLFYIFAPSWIALAAGSFCMGLLVFHFPATSAITADSLPPGQRGIGYATLMAIPGAIAILAPYVGAYIITLFDVNLGLRYLYTVTLIAGLTVSIIYLKFLKETLKEPRSKIGLRNISTIIKDSYRGVWETLRWMPRSLKALALIMTISLFFNWMAGPFWVVYSVDVIELTELEWGLIMLLVGGMRVGLSIPAGMMVDRFGKRITIIAALALSIFPVSIFTLCRTFSQTLIVLLVTAVTNSFLMPSCSTLLADVVPREKRGRVMASLGRGMLMIMAQGSGGGGGPGIGMLLTIPMMLGSLVSGYVYSFNPTYPWFLLSFALFLCLILTVIVVKEPEKPEP